MSVSAAALQRVEWAPVVEVAVPLVMAGFTDLVPPGTADPDHAVLQPTPKLEKAVTSRPLTGSATQRRPCRRDIVSADPDDANAAASRLVEKGLLTLWC